MFLGLLGATGMAAFLAGCENPRAGGTHLPDPFGPDVAGGGVWGGGPERDIYPPLPKLPLPPPPTPHQPPVAVNGIFPRTLWAKAGPDIKHLDPMNGIKRITFHHSGDPKPFITTNFSETAQHLEFVRSYHRSRNFQDIGYHFAIDRAGRVWQLRSLMYQGQHVRGNNEHNLGVVVLGNFDQQAMSPAQKDKVKIFGTLLRKQYNLPVSRIYTHQEIVSTGCPGKAMQPYLVSLRKQQQI